MAVWYKFDSWTISKLWTKCRATSCPYMDGIKSLDLSECAFDAMLYQVIRAAKSLAAIFYVVDPRDSFRTAISIATDQAFNVIALAAIEAAVITHLHRSRHRDKRNGVPVQRYMINDTWSSLACGLLEMQFIRLAIDTFPDTYTWFPITASAQKFWRRVGPLPTFIAASLVFEFGYYWFHRCSHEINVLWALHQVHHSGQDMNMSTNARRHFLTPYVAHVFSLPMVLLGFPQEVHVLHAALNNASQIWIHARLIPRLHPFIEYIFNTPSHHRVHHGRNPYALDKNYGGFLIIFDRLFGTFAEERDSEPVVYGLTTPLRTANPVTVQTRPLIGVSAKFLATRPRRLAPLSLICGPGWSSARPNLRLGDIDGVPRVPNLVNHPDALDAVRFEPPLHWVTRLYLFLNLAVLGYTMTSGTRRRVTGLIDVAWFAYAFLATGSMGLVWDGHLRWGFSTELMRWCVGIAMMFEYGIPDDGAETRSLTFLSSGLMSISFCVVKLYL